MVTDAECVYQALAEKSDILNCRSGKDITDYDLVMGGVANDKVFNTVELYFDGLRGVKRYDSESCFASKKYSRVIECFAKQQGISLDAALQFFYHSEVYRLVRDGVSDMHCMSNAYLAEELRREYADKSKIC